MSASTRPLMTGWGTPRKVGSLLALLWAVAGCSAPSDEPVRTAISGSVTFEGQPIPTGEIFFQPDADAGNTGPASNADIVDSKYSLPQQFGVLGGAYVVRITGYSPAGSGAGPLTLRGAPMFADYVTKVDLDRSGSAIEQNFDVPSAKK